MNIDSCVIFYHRKSARTTKLICNGTPRVWKKQVYARRFTSGYVVNFHVKEI
jgi:mRNA deadenylase 3'-5' endonuclease subunit Ccr4